MYVQSYAIELFCLRQQDIILNEALAYHLCSLSAPVYFCHPTVTAASIPADEWLVQDICCASSYVFVWCYNTYA